MSAARLSLSFRRHHGRPVSQYLLGTLGETHEGCAVDDVVIDAEVQMDDVAFARLPIVENQLFLDGADRLLINSAGYALGGAAAETTIAQARDQFEVNLFGVLRMCQEVLPSMIRQRNGVIVNISSLAGLIGLPFQAIYCATKFALEGLTESLRHEVSPFGIDVVLVEPGDVRTNITRNRARAVHDVDSVYAQHCATVMHIVEQEEMNGISAEAVAELIVGICESRSRRLRYSCGHISQSSVAWAKKLLPDVIVERLVGNYYRVARSAPRRLRRSVRL